MNQICSVTQVRRKYTEDQKYYEVFFKGKTHLQVIFSTKAKTLKLKISKIFTLHFRKYTGYITFVSKRKPLSSTNLYLVTLAVADLTVCFIGQLCRAFPRALTGYDTGITLHFLIKNRLLVQLIKHHKSPMCKHPRKSEVVKVLSNYNYFILFLFQINNLVDL